MSDKNLLILERGAIQDSTARATRIRERTRIRVLSSETMRHSVALSGCCARRITAYSA